MLVEHSSNRLFLDGTKLLHHPRRLADWQSGKRVFPLHLDISPAGACNHRCVFCIVDYKEHRKGFLNGSILKKLLRDGAQLGVKSVLFAGDGEPLLNRDLPDAIVEGHDHGLSLALNTNAVMLKEDVAEIVLPRLEWMRVSVAAGTAATYAEIHKCKERDFERAIENVAFVVAAAQVGLHDDGRRTWGHSMIVDPWGKVMVDMGGSEPGLAVVDLDLDQVTRTRDQIPSLRNERDYTLRHVTASGT